MEMHPMKKMKMEYKKAMANDTGRICLLYTSSSVMQSVSAFVAQNVGAGNLERARKGFLTAMASGCAVGILIFLAGFFGGEYLSAPFTSDREVIMQSASYLKGFSVDCILTCILFSSIGYFNGQGNSCLLYTSIKKVH